MKSGYVVNGGTVRGYWNTAKRIAVQIRYKSGTDPVQNWYRSGTKVGQIRYKTGTEVGQKWDRSETEVGHVQGEAGAKNWGQRPHFPTIEAAYLIGYTSKGGARYRNRPQDAKTGRNRIAPKILPKRPKSRCKLSGAKCPVLGVGIAENAIQAF